MMVGVSQSRARVARQLKEDAVVGTRRLREKDGSQSQSILINVSGGLGTVESSVESFQRGNTFASCKEFARDHKFISGPIDRQGVR